MGDKEGAEGFFGSSPHKWGIRVGHQLRKPHSLVHPHTSGEYIKECSVNTLAYGSSPHKWGIQLVQHGRHVRFRFIPTQVGNTRVPL